MATVTLGAEYDQRLVAATKWALRKVGARRGPAWWAIVGSQDITHGNWVTKQGPVSVEAETYVGLTITGPDEIVERIVELIDAKLSR